MSNPSSAPQPSTPRPGPTRDDDGVDLLTTQFGQTKSPSQANRDPPGISSAATSGQQNVCDAAPHSISTATATRTTDHEQDTTPGRQPILDSGSGPGPGPDSGSMDVDLQGGAAADKDEEEDDVSRPKKKNKRGNTPEPDSDNSDDSDDSDDSDSSEARAPAPAPVPEGGGVDDSGGGGSQGSEVDPATFEQDEVVQPFFRALGPKVGFDVDEQGTFKPIESYSGTGRSMHVLHGKTGDTLKSTFLECTREACEAHDGYGALYLSDTSKLSDLLHQVLKKWGGEEPCPNRPYILIDLPRGFSGKMQEAGFWAALECLLTSFTSGKYEGGEHHWPGEKPLIILSTNARPIFAKDEHSKPICHVSADRLMGNVYQVELRSDGYTLVQDVYCDTLALRVREAEEAEEAVQLAQSKQATVLTPKAKFEKYVLSGEPGKFAMDASAPRSKWVPYTTLHLAFRKYASDISLKGPGCMSQLMAEWYEDELADGRLKCETFRKDGTDTKNMHFSIIQVPSA